MSSLRVSILLCIFISSVGAAQAKSCPAEKAHYSIAGAKGFALSFKKAKEPNAWSDLIAVLKTPTRLLEYSFTASNGYSNNYLVPLPYDEKDDSTIHFYGFDKNLKITDLPNLGKAAPLQLFIPELGTVLYYGDVDKREFLPTEMWNLSCTN